MIRKLEFFVLGLCLAQVSSLCNKPDHAWPTGANGEFSIKVPEDSDGWKVTVTFDQQVEILMVWNGANVECDGNICTFENVPYNGQQSADTVMSLGYQVQFR